MPTIIRNTPSELIPQELFTEEKMQEYWNLLHPNLYQESVGTDELEEFFLLYPKPKDAETVHEISLMYQHVREKFPDQADAIGLFVHDKSFNLLVLKNKNIVFTGFFNFNTYEDIVYHLANIAQQFFEDIAQIPFYYNQIYPKLLCFLSKYFEMIEY